jgi:hypothetical protein
LVLSGPQICEKKINCKKLRAMTDDNASANNDDDGRQVMTLAHIIFGQPEWDLKSQV